MHGFQVINVIMVWMPALFGLVIKWSISGFLQRKTTPWNSLPSHELRIRKKLAMYAEKMRSLMNDIKVAAWKP